VAGGGEADGAAADDGVGEVCFGGWGCGEESGVGAVRGVRAVRVGVWVL